MKEIRSKIYLSEGRSVVSESLTYGLYSPWNSSGQNTGVVSLSLLQGIFPTRASNPALPYCRCILYQLSLMRDRGKQKILQNEVTTTLTHQWEKCPAYSELGRRHWQYTNFLKRIFKLNIYISRAPYRAAFKNWNN